MKIWASASDKCWPMPVLTDVATVVEQGLMGVADVDLIDVCRGENRCLITLDLDFSNPFIFPPEDYAGIVVIRLPRRSAPEDLYQAVRVLISAFKSDAIEGRLWFVERRRIRQYQPE